MPEILTESFCERCGTRYTFESAAPRVAKLKGIKVLSRGLKNFVMSDDTSMDEAMAAARSETDREATAQQLDAFHKTFNFCMSCRQYTCGNCWNQAEGRCLSCAPHLGQDIMPAPFPDLDPVTGVAATVSNGANGHAHEEVAPLAWPSMDLDQGLDEPTADDLSDLEPVDAAARLAALGASDDDAAPQPVEAVDAPAAAQAAEIDEVAAGAGPAEVVAADAPPAPEVEPATTIEPVGEPPVAAAPEVPTPAPASSSPLPTDPTDVPGRAAAAAVQTNDLLRRFRPGQSLDDELEAFERERAAAAGIAAGADMAEGDRTTPVAAQPVPEVEPEPVAAQLVPEAEPEPVAAQPSTAPARDDIVSQPTWQIVAPESDAAPTPSAEGPTTPDVPVSPPAVNAEPQWPAQPQWPSRSSGGGLPSLGRPARPTGGLDALWAESAREVITTPAAPLTLGGSPARPAPGGVQPCVSCGLSLSATARFCRRCGSRQG